VVTSAMSSYRPYVAVQCSVMLLIPESPCSNLRRETVSKCFHRLTLQISQEIITAEAFKEECKNAGSDFISHAQTL
jgi:hypothetical protein